MTLHLESSKEQTLLGQISIETNSKEKPDYFFKG